MIYSIIFKAQDSELDYQAGIIKEKGYLCVFLSDLKLPSQTILQFLLSISWIDGVQIET